MYHDAMNAIIRYFRNNFADGYRQVRFLSVSKICRCSSLLLFYSKIIGFSRTGICRMLLISFLETFE